MELFSNVLKQQYVSVLACNTLHSGMALDRQTHVDVDRPWLETSQLKEVSSSSTFNTFQRHIFFSLYSTAFYTTNHNCTPHPSRSLLAWLVTDGLIGFNKAHLHVSLLEVLQERKAMGGMRWKEVAAVKR